MICALDEILTSSGETGLWLVLRSSSMILGSRRKSFLQPTRMMGRFWQKWRTSEIHCGMANGEAEGRRGGIRRRQHAFTSVHTSHLLASREACQARLCNSIDPGHPCTHLFLDVVKRVGGVNGEADEDDVRVGVRQRTESVVVFLASSIPKGQLDVLAVDLDVGDVVLEDGRDVDLVWVWTGKLENRARQWTCSDSKTATGGIKKWAKLTSGKVPREKTIKRHVLPQAPSYCGARKGVETSRCKYLA